MVLYIAIQSRRATDRETNDNRVETTMAAEASTVSLFNCDERT
jgi:hypothetical protein